MTDSQAINSSECAMMRDKLEQTQVKLGGIRFGTHGADASYLALQATLASHDLIYRLEQLQRRLDQQEQASAGDFSKAPILTPDILLGDSPQFAVGDTVRYDGHAPFFVMIDYKDVDLKITGLRAEYDKKEIPCATCEIVGGKIEQYQVIPLANLTLVRKAGKR